MTSNDAREAIEQLMEAYSHFGANDTEGRAAVRRVERAAAEGKPFPLRGADPFELYESVDGWQTASEALRDAAKLYWLALVGERFNVECIERQTISESDENRGLTALGLKAKYGGPNERGEPGEHPEHTVWDWAQRVAQRATRHGYWQWVFCKIEGEYDGD